ncbi:MAG: hypothetical protein JNM69_29390 [Archangium sp.]|nr:hypothetical protein [Archangium sp.]
MTRPFLFLGHGEGSGTFDLLVALEDPAGDVTPLLGALENWAQGRDELLMHDGAVVAVSAVLKRAPKLHEGLAKALEGLPIGLVVRTNKVNPSTWHTESVANTERLLSLLERHVKARAGSDYAFLPIDLSGEPSVHQAVWRSIHAHSHLGALLQAAISSVSESLEGEALDIFNDQLLGRLPSWAGLDFGVDLVVQQLLARARSVSPTSIEMPGHFLDAFDAMVRAHHANEQGHDEDEELEPGDIDWSSVDAIRERLRAEPVDWVSLQQALRDTNREHVETLLALTHEERVALAQHGQLGLLQMNAATTLMTSGEFAKALVLYDSGLEGKVHAMSAANPLFAVQNDNNHLGVVPERSRRYLDRCLPFGPENPTVFLNGACVAVELGEYDEAMALLEKARAHGVAVKPFKNEALFIPLRDRRDFKVLMT